MSEGLYVRTCQECGHHQVMKDPADQKSDVWTEVKCRACKSISMDYGSYGWQRTETGDLIQESSGFVA